MKVLKTFGPLSIAALAICVLSPSSAIALTIINEDFESYGDTAALGGVWSLGDGTLDTVNGNPGQSLDHPGTAGSFSGGNTNSLSFAEINLGPGESLTYSADIFDDGSIANNRTTAGIREAAGANIIEMGMYNSPSHYAYRVILFGPGDPSWVAFSNLIDDGGSPIDNVPVEGWHRFQATITDSEVALSLDLNSDGNINGTAVVPISPIDLGFDILRLGGPSDLSSAGGGVKFDNVSLEFIPEPTTLALASLASVWMLSRRR